ncbi:MAG: NAD(P)/FAD-dependent oxidoreductase [Dehalococcoidaceae bacterium]|nr:NAD(P)/FAD-dependent oxidoreductase [Dehalococcoidaceae bacterium]
MQDILIIGAGPAGSYTARHLANLGFKVTVIDKQPGLGNPVCCAGIISPECIDMAGIGQSPVIRRLNSARVFSPMGQTLNLYRNGTQAVTVDRAQMDRLMTEKAIEAGAEYIPGKKVTGIEFDNDRVKLMAGSKSRLKIEGRMLVMAAGFNPALTAAAGLGKVADFAVGAQVRVETEEATELKVFLSSRFAPGFFAWLEPLQNGEALAGLLARKNAFAYLEAFIEHLKKSKGTRLAGKPEYRGVSLAPLRKTYARRVLVTGDCAGQIKPLTGGGVYYGLKAAEAAVKTINTAFQNGDFSASALAGYQRLWQNMFMKDIRFSRFGRRIIESFSDRRMEKAFTAVMRAGLVEKLAGDENLRFDHHGKVVMRALAEPAFYRAFFATVLP